MSCNVKVRGIPSHVKMGQLIPLFSDILSMRSSDFRLRILSSNGPVKNVLLCLPTYLEAQLAQEKLDSFEYRHRNITYMFTANMHGDYNQYTKKPRTKSKFKNQNKQMYSQHNEEYCRDRSRSPHYEDESSQLDMQLEILRKQRMILAEERKLLEDQRKLNELKMRSYNMNESLSETRTYEDVESCELPTNSSKKKSEFKQPTFYQASKVLIKSMRMFINNFSTLVDHKALVKQVCSIIKQRLTELVAAEGRGTYQTHKVIKLYRSQYPTSEDEELVIQALKDVQEGPCTSGTAKVQMSIWTLKDLKGATAKKPDATESAADSHTLKEEEATAKDITQSGASILSKNVEEKGTKKYEEKRLYFFKSSTALIRKMRFLVNEHSTPETRNILLEYLRLTLKQRLSAVVGGQPIYQTHKIIKLYREQHPHEEDIDLIKQLAKDIEEGRVPEEVMIKCKQNKEKSASGEKNDSTIDNNTKQDKILNIEDVTDTSGQPEGSEGADVSENTENEGDVEKNIDDKVQPAIENQNNEENKDESTIGIGPDVKNADEGNDNIENNSPNDSVNDKFEKDVAKPDIHDNDSQQIADDIMTDVTAPEATQNCSDDVKVTKDSHGVKRKTDEDKNNCIKVAKTDNVEVISSEDTNKNDLEDKDCLLFGTTF